MNKLIFDVISVGFKFISGFLKGYFLLSIRVSSSSFSSDSILISSKYGRSLLVWYTSQTKFVCTTSSFLSLLLSSSSSSVYFLFRFRSGSVLFFLSCVTVFLRLLRAINLWFSEFRIVLINCFFGTSYIFFFSSFVVVFAYFSPYATVIGTSSCSSESWSSLSILISSVTFTIFSTIAQFLTSLEIPLALNSNCNNTVGCDSSFSSISLANSDTPVCCNARCQVAFQLEGYYFQHNLEHRQHRGHG